MLFRNKQIIFKTEFFFNWEVTLKNDELDSELQSKAIEDRLDIM